MKETILTCDRCRVSIPAVGTYMLSNGKGKPATLDLCKKHQKELLVWFSPLRTAPVPISKAAPVSDEEWNAMLQSTYKYVLKHKEVTPKQVHTDTGLPAWRVNELLSELVNGKKLVRLGVARSSRYKVK
jgi:hypothetical protein